MIGDVFFFHVTGYGTIATTAVRVPDILVFSGILLYLIVDDVIVVTIFLCQQ